MAPLKHSRNPIKGRGLIELEAVKNGVQRKESESKYYRSEVVSMRHTYPFRFLAPEKSTPGVCRWIYPMNFGGGLVGGDSVKSSVTVGAGCAAVVSSQESTKVYHCNNGMETTQCMTYSVGDSSLLCLLQDPVVCYENADFVQKQIISMTPSSSLVILDWILSGRVALNESWSFRRFRNLIEIQMADETIIKDCLELENTPNRTVAQGMFGFQVYGTCIVLGDDVEFLADSLLTQYGRKLDIGDRGRQDFVVSVSETKYKVCGKIISGCYLRFLAADMKSATDVIRSITTPLMPILGDDPFQRKL